LCIAPCPVDCIALVAPPAPWTAADARAAQRRARARKDRLLRERPVTRARDRRALIAEVLGRRRAR